MTGFIYKMEQLLSQHRKELKDLQGKITALKKSTKSDKKKKGEVAEQIALWERELDEKHKAELLQLENSKIETSVQEGISTIKIDPENETQTEKKPGRQQARTLKKAQELQNIRETALQEAAHATNYKEREREAIDKKLAELGMEIKEIAADGHW